MTAPLAECRPIRVITHLTNASKRRRLVPSTCLGRSRDDHVQQGVFSFSTGAAAESDPPMARENRRAQTSRIADVCKSIFPIYSRIYCVKRKLENERFVLLPCCYLDFGFLWENNFSWRTKESWHSYHIDFGSLWKINVTWRLFMYLRLFNRFVVHRLRREILMIRPLVHTFFRVDYRNIDNVN